MKYRRMQREIDRLRKQENKLLAIISYARHLFTIGGDSRWLMDQMDEVLRTASQYEEAAP